MSEIQASSINLRNSEGVLTPLSDWKIGDFIATIATGGAGGGGGSGSFIGNGYTVSVVQSEGKLLLYATNNTTGAITPISMGGASSGSGEDAVTYSLDITFDENGNAILKIVGSDGSEYPVGQNGLAGNDSESTTTYGFEIDDSNPDNPVLKLVGSDGNEITVGTTLTESSSGSKYNLGIDDNDGTPKLTMTTGDPAVTTTILGLSEMTVGQTTASSIDLKNGDELTYIKSVTVDNYGRVTNIEKQTVSIHVAGTVVSENEPSTDDAIVWIKPDSE